METSYPEEQQKQLKEAVGNVCKNALFKYVSNLVADCN